MPQPMAAPDVLDREYLEVRARLLELAASFDRLDRGDGAVDGDPRMQLIRDALEVLISGRAERAEELQLLFSRHYDDTWQKNFDMPPPK